MGIKAGFYASFKFLHVFTKLQYLVLFSSFKILNTRKSSSHAGVVFHTFINERHPKISDKMFFWRLHFRCPGSLVVWYLVL